MGSAVPFLVAILVVLVACSDPAESTVIVATVGQTEEPGGALMAGDPLAGADIRILSGDATVAESVLDQRGMATVDWPAGVYTVQVSLDLGEHGCFWGSKLEEVEFPRERLDIAAFQVCTCTPPCED
jgi:hypothetical protein